MGKKRKLYLAKRMLAMILAAAMSVTMVPTTVSAASANGDVTEDIVNDITDGSSDVMPGEDASADGDSAADTGDTVPNDGSGAAATDNTVPADDEPSAVDAVGTDGNKEMDDDAADSTVDEAGQEPTDGEKLETNAEGDAAAAKPVYEISVSDAFETRAEYNGGNPFADILDYVTLTKDGEDVSDSVSCAWKQQGTDGKYAAMTGGPKNAGSYQAVLTYPKQDGVHDGAEKTVDCEITKASVTINLENVYDGKLSVAPGTKTSEVKAPVIDSVYTSDNGIDTTDLVLKDMKIKDALTGGEPGDVLKQGSDYVMELTPDFKEGTDAVKKNNYELKPFTVDLVVDDLIPTQITLKVADKWKNPDDGSFVITKEYDGKPIDDPKEGIAEDYTFEVTYEAADGSTKKLEGADVKAVGEWEAYTGCEVSEDGKVKAPTKAGNYLYNVVYAGQDGVYGGCEDYIYVEITAAQLTIEATNAAPLTVPENSTMPEVLAKITYKVLDKSGADVTAKVKADHIWGTSYSSSGKSQIYEPLFTLQESSDGETWNDIDADSQNYTLSKDLKYRVAFTGRKAVFNADGSYDVNSYYERYSDVKSDINDSNGVNGVDQNYYTLSVEPPKTLAVEVKAGTKAVIDVSGLLGENKGAEKIADLKAKQYDGELIYTTRSQYKNVVKLKAAEENGAAIRTEQREFTYTWERYTKGDRVDYEVAEKNQTLSEYDWGEIYNMVSPKNAGLYRLTISYEDKIDPDTYNYADPAVVYFAVDPRQVVIEPKEASYEVLEGRSLWDFFYDGEKEIEYTYKAVDGKSLPQENVAPRGQIVVKTSGEPAVSDQIYDQDEYLWDTFFEKNEKNTYFLRGGEIKYWNNEDGNNRYDSDSNYTCETSEVVMNGEVAERKYTSLNGDGKEITVVPMGTEKVTITVDATKWVAKEKVYDAKPFSIKDLVPDGLVTVTKADGTRVTGLNLSYRVPDEWGGDRRLDEVVDAGSYDLYVRFDGDKTYAPFGWNDQASYPDNLGLKLGTFKITKREIALTADLEESYTAGTDTYDVVADVKSHFKVNNYVEGQEVAFADKIDGEYLQAWGDYSGPEFYIAEKGSKDRVYTLQRNKTYEVRYDSESCVLEDDIDCWDNVNGVWIYPGIDYTVKNEPVAEFKVVPGNSEIESVYYRPIEDIAIQVKNDASDPMKRTVTMQEAIPYSKATLGGKSVEGNFVAFRFTAPAEYGSMPATAMYRNAIEAVGGYIVQERGSYFTAVFNAAEGDKTFKLRWEDGYLETYTLNFKAAVKLENLDDAVAPKALAFNAVNNKMAVGQTQQLDVKITKEQMGDVIYLGYESSDPTTLVVTEYGVVTALKIGKAEITVFPQHLVNGKAEKIPNAKTVKIAINVTKLDAPKKVKATAHGTYVELNYDSPAYGYRREIYVVEKSDSFKKAEQFEAVLKDMRENQWKEKGFAIAPVYINKSTEDSSRKNNGYVRSLSGLDVKTDYTIYVRNVCAVRTLTDGTGGVVTQAAMSESATGAVVNVKTKKAEVKDLSLSFYDMNAFECDTDGYYKVNVSKLKNGTVECWTEGAFREDEKISGENVWIKLPFAGADKTAYKDIYEEPKLEYALRDCYDKKTDTWGWGAKNEYASIDKKGKIKITGFPYGDEYGAIIYVRVRDTVTGAYDIGGLRLMIEDADAVMAAKKSVTLTVGQDQRLEDLLVYKSGKTKWTAYPNRNLDVAKVRKAIKDQKQEDFFELSESGRYLQAVKEGGTLTLELTDKNVENLLSRKGAETKNATASVTIKSKELEPVKGLKACDVSHNTFGLTFSYAGYADQFLLEISDVKKPIYSKVIDRYEVCEQVYVCDKDGKYIPKYDADGDWYDWVEVKNTYEIPRWWIQECAKFSKESQYTVSLTPIYGESKAKPATTKVKTTQIPAQDWYFENDPYSDSWACDRRGGMGITVSEGGYGMELGDDGSTTLYAVSGNTYTLTANVQYNRGRVNDTLVWTVGDSKVASVKAAAGTYCITLKGLKPGRTTLEVKSKIMGQVIARYDINVGAVRNAYNSSAYYGDNEPSDNGN